MSRLAHNIQHFQTWVKDTQDNAPSEFKSNDEVRSYCAKVLDEELGLKFDDVFAEWDDTPVGVASIGQVHRAVLKTTGETVAVKLQLPGIEERFRSDIRTLKTFCRLAFPQHVTAFDEIEKQFCTEFDYREEALNLQRVRSDVMPKWGKRVYIPAPTLALCSKHILIMEMLQGVKLVDGIRSQYSRLAAVRGITSEELENMQKLGTMQTLEESSSERWRLESAVWLSDTFLTANPLRFLFNISPLRLITGPMKYWTTELPIDLGETIKLLCQVHGYELFHCG